MKRKSKKSRKWPLSSLVPSPIIRRTFAEGDYVEFIIMAEPEENSLSFREKINLELNKLKFRTENEEMA